MLNLSLVLLIQKILVDYYILYSSFLRLLVANPSKYTLPLWRYFGVLPCHGEHFRLFAFLSCLKDPSLYYYETLRCYLLYP